MGNGIPTIGCSARLQARRRDAWAVLFAVIAALICSARLFAAIKDTGEFRLGHFREPFSLEGGASAHSFAFMERSNINQLDPARNRGAGLVQVRC